LFGGATVAGLDADADTSILSGSGGHVVREVREPVGTTWLLTGSGHRFDTGGTTTWRATNENRAAVALSPAGDGSSYEARAFRHDDDGWVATGPVQRSSTLFGCSDRTGRRLVVSGPTPMILDTVSGLRTRITGLESGGDCAFTADGVVVAQYAMSGAAHRTELVSAAADATVRWRQTYPLEARIRGDAGGRAFLVLLDGTARELDTAGSVLQTFDDVADARYDENGDVVVLGENGTPRWVPGKSRTPRP
jgi:hypothetical protein